MFIELSITAMSFQLDIVRLTLKVLELNIGHEGIVEPFQKTGKLE